MAESSERIPPSGTGVPPPPPALSPRPDPWRGVQRFRELVILLLIVGLVAAMGLYNRDFVNWLNLHAILLGLAVQAIVAIGMTVLLVAGGFDLSVGSTAALAGMVTALCLLGHVPVALAIVAGLAAGALVGTLNGLIIARLGINPFVTTLAMMGIVRGLVLVISGGQNKPGLPRSFTWIGQNSVTLWPRATDPISIQYPVLFALVLVLVGDVLLRKSRFFRQNYYLGGNERAALLSGIPVRGLTIFNYALIGVLAALAGILQTARYGSASVNACQGLELQVITAVIVGGASLQGGEGTVAGSFLGCLLMASVVGALTFLSVPADRQTLVIGATLLAAVVVDRLAKGRRQ